LRTLKTAITGLAVASLVVGLVATGGCTNELAPIVLDISKNCNEIDVQVLANDLGARTDGADDQILAVASDGTSSTSSWALVAPAGASDLRVWHLVGGTRVAEVNTAISANVAPNTRLRPSPRTGEVYLTLQGPSTFFLTRLLDNDGTIFTQSSGNLGSFPNDMHTCNPCETSNWYRDLIFLEGEPHLLSVPPFSPTVAISVWVGALRASPPDTGSFQIDTEHRLNFEPRCDSSDADEDLQACETTNALVSHPSVQVLARQSDPTTTTAAILASRERQEEGLPYSTHDVFVVHVGLDDDGVPAGILRSEQSNFEIIQPPGPPAGLAVDDFATYAMVTMPVEGTRLLRLELARFEEGFEDLFVDELEDKRVLQLENDLGLGRVRDGAWEITKLFPDDVTQSQTVTYTSLTAPIVEAEAAGPGMFLLRRQQAPPQLVRLVCASGEQDDDEGTTDGGGTG